MKANVIRILVENCNKEYLTRALSLLDTQTQEKIIELLQTKGKKEVLSITSVEIQKFCSEVRVGYQYKWYKTEEDAQSGARDYNSYKSDN